MLCIKKRGFSITLGRYLNKQEFITYNVIYNCCFIINFHYEFDENYQQHKIAMTAYNIHPILTTLVRTSCLY